MSGANNVTRKLSYLRDDNAMRPYMGVLKILRSS